MVVAIESSQEEMRKGVAWTRMKVSAGGKRNVKHVWKER